MRNMRSFGRMLVAAATLLVMTGPAPGGSIPAVVEAQTLPPPRTPPDGILRVLVIGCMFDGDQILDPGSLLTINALPTDGIYTLLDGSRATTSTVGGPTLQDYFIEVSHQRIRDLQPTFAGWHSIGPVTNGDVAEDRCNQAAIDSGFDPSAYGAFVVLSSLDIGDTNHYADPPLDWVHLRSSGGHGGWTSMATWAHEIGHRFGLPHSHTTVPINGDPEYSNPYDAMSGFDHSSNTFFPFDTPWCVRNPDSGYDSGYQCESATASARAVPVYYSAYQENRLGWLYGRVATHTAGTHSYFIERLAQPHENYEPLMVSVEPPNTTRRFTIEARRRIGYDVGLPGEGVIVHAVDPNGEGTKIGPAALMCCNSQGQDPDLANAALQPGDVLRLDAGNSLSVDSFVDDATHSGYWVTVKTIDVPSLLSIQPGATKVGGGDARVSLRAENYDNSSRVQVNDDKVLVPDASLNVTVPTGYATVGRNGGAVVLKVLNGYGTSALATSNYKPLFVTPSGVDVLGADTGVPGSAALAAGGTVVAETPGSTNRLYAVATGTKGTLSIGRFSQNPLPVNSRTVNGGWIGVALGMGETFSQLALDDCALGNGSTVYWWDGSKWTAVSNQTATTADGCRRLTFDSTTVPRTKDLDPIGYFATGPQ